MLLVGPSAAVPVEVAGTYTGKTEPPPAAAVLFLALHGFNLRLVSS